MAVRILEGLSGSEEQVSVEGKESGEMLLRGPRNPERLKKQLYAQKVPAFEREQWRILRGVHRNCCEQ